MAPPAGRAGVALPKALRGRVNAPAAKGRALGSDCAAPAAGTLALA